MAVTAPAGKIEVLEFFSYGCPHCYALEPTLEGWAKRLPADVVFKRVPVGFNALYENYQKIYYALEAMGQVEHMHRKVFDAIHQQRQRLDKEADIAAFMTANGLDGAKFIELYKSFSVQTKARQAQQLSQSYKIDGVPAMARAGPLRDLRLAGRQQRARAGRHRRAGAEPAQAHLSGRPCRVRRSALTGARLWLFAPACEARKPIHAARMACKFRAARRVRHPLPHPSPADLPRSRWRWPRLAPRPAQAEKADRSKPMSIEADKPGSVDLQRQVVIFNGNVVISQGTMVLRADRVELRERPDGYREAMAIGSAERPASFRQKRDGVDETVEGAAERIEFDARTDTLRFVGNAAVRRLRAGVRGRRDHRLADHLGQHQRVVQGDRWRGLADQPDRPGARGVCAARGLGRLGAEGRAHAGAAEAVERARGDRVERPAARPTQRRARTQPAGCRPKGCARASARAWWSRTCTWPSAPARWWACSAPTAPARPPPSTWWSG